VQGKAKADQVARAPNKSNQGDAANRPGVMSS